MLRRQLLLATAGLSALSSAPTAIAQIEFQVTIAPPPLRLERVPPARRGFVWVPGYWDWNYRRRQHQWVDGRWERARPGYVYDQPRWMERNGRWRLEQGGWRRGRDRDSDGVRNRDDRDRDGDGVPNRRDRWPGNPNRN